MELLSRILGEYTMQFVMITSSLPMMLFCHLLFAVDMNRRKYYPLLLTMCFAAIIGIDLALAVLRTHYNNIYTRLLVYFMTYFSLLPMIHICYREQPINVLLNWCAAVAVEEIASRMFTLMVVLSGHNHYETITLFADFNELRDWAVMYFIQASIIILLFFLFRRAKCMEADKRTVNLIAQLSVFFAVWMLFIHAFSREYMRQSNALYMLVTTCCTTFCFAVLMLRNGILTTNQYRQEISMTEKLLSEERKLYDSVKENIEIVNMRCHDLKHQLEDLSYKLTEDELLRLQEAIRIYDNTIKTGSEVLDIVIYEKQLIFNKENIRFTVMADGSCLKFMRTTHIYALFNNALGNALEAVRKLDDPAMKVIDLTVRQNNGFLEITVSNYFNGELNPGNATTKDDRTHHGLGIRSMRYIAELYHGVLTTTAAGSVFDLFCRIPLPEK